mgnify:CR=1 FL=1
MVAQAQRAGAAEEPDPPEQDRHRQEEAGQQPPAALGQRRQDLEPVLRSGRLEGEPGELPDELDRIPVHRGPHVEADDLKSDKAAKERENAKRAEINRTDLRVTKPPGQMQQPGCAATR